jgi:hypothetical protein
VSAAFPMSTTTDLSGLADNGFGFFGIRTRPRRDRLSSNYRNFAMTAPQEFGVNLRMLFGSR